MDDRTWDLGCYDVTNDEKAFANMKPETHNAIRKTNKVRDQIQEQLNVLCYCLFIL